MTNSELTNGTIIDGEHRFLAQLTGQWTEAGEGFPSSHIVLRAARRHRTDLDGNTFVFVHTVCGLDGSVAVRRLGQAPQGPTCGKCAASDARHFGRSWPVLRG